ncbi:unnamed protein product [Vicia faba]|uniref:Uncharacterized protein n=1 Tax=Vicia faba TaxID=3906 RepID=A0AAV0YDJ4_VICFA|nr:unnamed protein product [Vicia faba]
MHLPEFIQDQSIQLFKEDEEHSFPNPPRNTFGRDIVAVNLAKKSPKLEQLRPVEERLVRLDDLRKQLHQQYPPQPVTPSSMSLKSQPPRVPSIHHFQFQIETITGLSITFSDDNKLSFTCSDQIRMESHALLQYCGFAREVLENVRNGRDVQHGAEKEINSINF